MPAMPRRPGTPGQFITRPDAPARAGTHMTLPEVSPPHAEPPAALFERLISTPDGLSQQEAEARLRRVGPNRLEPARPVSAWKILADQLRSVVVVLLVAAAAIALRLREPVEAAAIAAVLAINTLVGFVTEWRARRAMAALIHLDVPRAFVVRGGRLRGIDAETLVPGDLVEIETGQQVPADGRTVTETGLRTREAAPTGQSLPACESADAVPVATPPAERTSMAYKGTTVAAGTARVLATGTGAATEVGRIGVLVRDAQDEPAPLERRLDELGHRLVWLALGVAAVVSALGALQGAALALVVETGLALAVAAVPEALPAVATIALAVGVRRMARRRALVRRLPAVEALGSTTVVCTDKTRTLTSGRMTLVRLWTAGGAIAMREASPPHDAAIVAALEVAALASRPQPRAEGSREPHGDPVETALLAAAERAGVDR